MDFPLIVEQMRLDALAVDASACLSRAGIPHALIKGPTTARWLYSPPRRYRDVDLLVPGSQANLAASSLLASGVAASVLGRVGEQASHALLLASPSDVELDLHVTLPLLQLERNDPDRAWRVLAQELEDISLDGILVPSLNEPARCVVLALHALGERNLSAAPWEDLRRARSLVSAEVWNRAQVIAENVGAGELVTASIAHLEGRLAREDLPIEVRLIQSNALGAFRLERIRRGGLASIPGQIIRELFPSRAFLRQQRPDIKEGRTALCREYVRRLVSLQRQLPAAWVAMRDARGKR
jgi:hypothetical protein